MADKKKLTSIQVDIDKWNRYGKLLKALESKSRSERYDEILDREITRLEKKLIVAENKESKLQKLMVRKKR